MFAITREVVGMAPYEEARRELLAYPSKSITATAAVASDGQVVGFCTASHPYWNAIAILDYLAVAPSCRNQGMGASLLCASEQSLQAMGLRRLCAQTIA